MADYHGRKKTSPSKRSLWVFINILCADLIFSWYLGPYLLCLDYTYVLRLRLINFLLNTYALGFYQTLTCVPCLLGVVDVYLSNKCEHSLLSWQHTFFKHHTASPNPVKIVCFGTD
jgi:hypothetical protein